MLHATMEVTAMSRFMRFWKRLGVVVGIPLVVLVLAITTQDHVMGTTLMGSLTTLALLYVGIGWALNAFFQRDD